MPYRRGAAVFEAVPKTSDAVRGQFYPIKKRKVVVGQAMPDDKLLLRRYDCPPPDGSAPSPRISNTQLTFRVEILSSPVERGISPALL